MNHDNAVTRHPPYKWVVADAAALAAVVPTSDDLYKTALQLDTAQVYTLTDDSPVTWTATGGGAVGAPANATYITQTANGSLTNEQALSALSTGMVKVTTTTGVLSTGVEGTDYYKPGGTDVAVADGGTGASTAAGARTNLGLDSLVTGFSVTLGDATTVITSAAPPVIVRMPVAVTVTAWYLEADASGSITLEVERAASGSPTTFSSVAGSEKPALSSAQTNSDTSPFSGGDTTWDAGDRIKIYVSGTPSTVKQVWLHFALTRAAV